MAMDFATGYASIVKYDKNDDGTLMVYGKATDDTLDLDSQICDPKWLDTAMPQWFKTGGNIREMHGPSAAGVAKEYEAKSDGHFIGVHVVDPLAAKKVEAGVYTGFSIGIKSPRVVRDQKAANGRIIDGQIIEVSLVDRPANPSAKLILAKSVEGESSLVQVEESHEYSAPLPSDIAKHGDHDQADHGGGGGGGSSESQFNSDARDNEQINGDSREAQSVADGVSDLASELRNSGDDEGAEIAEQAQSELVDAINALDEAREGSDKEHALALENAHSSLLDAHSSLTDVDHGDAEDLQDQIAEIGDRIESYLDGFYGRDEEKSLTTKGKSKMRKINRITELAKSLTTVDAAKFDKTLFDNARRALAELIASEAKEMAEGHDERNSLAALAGAVEALMAWYEGEGHEGEVHELVEAVVAEEKAAAPEDCADGKCGKCTECMSKAVKPDDSTEDEESDQAPDTQEDDDEVDIKDKKKSADTEEATEEVATEDSAPAEETDTAIEEIVEKAVKSAMKSVEAEIASLRADKEAAVEKSVKLETELATALTKAVAGGPKRTASPTVAVSNEYLVKAATYKAKADATTDPVLAKGYRDLYLEFYAKAAGETTNKNA